MWRRRKQTQIIIDLTDEALLDAVRAPTTCASCERTDRLYQLVHSRVSLCGTCFREMYTAA